MPKSNFIAFLPLIIPFLSISQQSVESIPNSVLTTDLIHRDHSPQSPSYDPSLTPFQRTIAALKRSSNRSRRFNAPGSSALAYSGGDYLMRFFVGSPPVPSLGIADTGSDAVWTQCQPCIQCFNQSLPIFVPKSSRTYRKALCNTTTCNYLPQTYCSIGNQNHCLYALQYGDKSYSYGQIAKDTFTLGTSSASFPNIVFGCGFKNGGVFSGSESGIVGLGGGKASLVRQLGRGKFSYFLGSTSGSSKLWVGSSKISGKGVVSTPLVRKIPDTFYYLTLKGVRVGNDEFAAGSGHEGNMIIDSGTTLTFLPRGLYDEVEAAVRGWVKLERVEDPERVLSLCFGASEIGKIPEVVLRFKGADVKLRSENLFVRTGDVATCLALKPTDDVAIFGNVAQVNLLVGYDLRKRTVSFKPTD